MDTKSEHTRESKVDQSCIKNKMHYLYVGEGGGSFLIAPLVSSSSS